MKATMERVKQLANDGRSADAAALCTQLIEQFPGEFEPYFQRAHAHWTADLGEAIARDHKLGSAYYADCAPLIQAIGYLMLGKFELAQSALDALPREMKSYVAGQLWTRAEGVWPPGAMRPLGGKRRAAKAAVPVGGAAPFPSLDMPQEAGWVEQPANRRELGATTAFAAREARSH